MKRDNKKTPGSEKKSLCEKSLKRVQSVNLKVELHSRIELQAQSSQSHHKTKTIVIWIPMT